MSTPSLRDAVHVAPRFHRSVNIELDFARADALDGYVVSPLARRVTFQIVRGLKATDGARAWTLIGPYGSGKSSLVSFLTALSCEGPAHMHGHARFERAWPEDAGILTDDIDGEGGFGPLVPVLIVGERMPLGRAILIGLDRAAQAFWSGPGKKPAEVGHIAEARAAADAGEAIEHDAIVELTLAFAAKAHASSRPGNGLFIVIDEMGKLLEWAAAHPDDADLYLLQRLAEAAARSPVTVGLLTVLHQDLGAYAVGLTRSLRDEWTKIGGRFETIGYLEKVHHIVRLLDGAIDVDPRALDTPAARACREAAAALAEGDLFRQNLPLAGAFPLDPLTALSVGPLFRTAIGQNERSVFAFLNAREPLGFQDWLSKADGSAPYRLADLFDYAVHNTRALVEGARVWSGAEFALSRLAADADPLDAALVKSIAVLTMVQAPAEVRADEQTLALAVGRNRAETRRALNRLKKRSVALFVSHRGAWTLWDGSDVDIDAVLAHHRSVIRARGGLAERLEAAVKPTPITASRHYITRGTFRVLRVRYTSTVAAATRVRPRNGDGALILIVPDAVDALADVRAALDAVPAQPADAPPRALCVPANVAQVHDVGLDLLAVNAALERTPALESDPIARRVLQERQLALRDALQAAHDTACAGTPERPARWRFEGQWHTVSGRASSQASAIFDHAFARAPQIHNELINRARVSSAAAGGRRVLMQRMLEHAALDRLGIEGHPPELSMYRSILERMGVHREIDGRWRLADPPADSLLAAVWSRLGELAQPSDAPLGARTSIEALTDALACPPYGVRAGVAPILIWAWYLVHQETIFLYEEGTFRPKPESALVERMLRQPQHIELQAAAFSGRLAEIVTAIQQHSIPELNLKRGNAPLRVVRQLVMFVRRLSLYATRTETVSVEARRVRSAITAAKDTVKLLAVALPEALEVDLDEPEGAEALAAGLGRALADLAAADDRLLDAIEFRLGGLFGEALDTANGRRRLVERAEALLAAGDVASRIQGFIEQTAQLKPDDAESRRIWLTAVARAVMTKSPARWDDRDLDSFQEHAEPRVRAFRAAERLALQMKRLNGHAERPLLRVDFISSEGGYERGQFGVLELDTDEMTAVRTAAEAEVQGLRDRARASGVSDHGVAYAILEAMMKLLPDNSIPESK